MCEWDLDFIYINYIKYIVLNTATLVELTSKTFITSNIDNTNINSIVSLNKELSYIGYRFGETHIKQKKISHPCCRSKWHRLCRPQ